MPKRVLVGGMHHESDTFNPIVTGERDVWVRRGDELLCAEREDSLSGAIATLRSAGYDVVPTLIARAVPNGEWDKAFYLSLKDELLDALRAALPVDAICLSLHGSMRVKDLGEAEGDLLQSIRDICPDVPIFSSLDMHATMTRRMLANCDGFVGYKCAPHTDTYETGVHAAKMTIEALERGLSPKMSAVHVPILIAGEQSETSVEPMNRLIPVLREYEKRPGVMAASYLLGFPWADTAENGVTALVVTDGDQRLANDAAMDLARLFWDTRHDFRFYNETHEPEQALEAAWDSVCDGVWPVVISDSGDNPTAGSSQDVTNFLKMIIADANLSKLDPPLCYQGIYDPVVVAQAIMVGVGGVVIGDLGARFDTRSSSPIPIRSTVKAVRKRWEGAQGKDLALLDVEGVDVVVTSGHVGCYDPEMMRTLGVVPEDRKVIVVKLGYLEPEIRAIAKRSMMALTDGSSNEVFTRLPYSNLTRPIFPLDGDFDADLAYLWGN